MDDLHRAQPPLPTNNHQPRVAASRHEPCKRSPTLAQKWFESKVTNYVEVEGLGILLVPVMFLRDTNVLVNAQDLDRDHAANQVVEQGLQHQAHVPTASLLFVNESRPRSGQSTPTPSHEPFSYHKCISRTQAVRPSTGPRGTLPFRTTRGKAATAAFNCCSPYSKQ